MFCHKNDANNICHKEASFFISFFHKDHLSLVLPQLSVSLQLDLTFKVLKQS